ncbi:hypothetical protein B0H19DRAFT_314296 [Mycena capillaripes]|nr:hypothetical protein B0H19DRAFT_314296 [Mycena capillaripes]
MRLSTCSLRSTSLNLDLPLCTQLRCSTPPALLLLANKSNPHTHRLLRAHRTHPHHLLRLRRVLLCAVRFRFRPRARERNAHLRSLHCDSAPSPPENGCCSCLHRSCWPPRDSIGGETTWHGVRGTREPSRASCCRAGTRETHPLGDRHVHNPRGGRRKYAPSILSTSSWTFQVLRSHVHPCVHQLEVSATEHDFAPGDSSASDDEQPVRSLPLRRPGNADETNTQLAQSANALQCIEALVSQSALAQPATAPRPYFLTVVADAATPALAPPPYSAASSTTPASIAPTRSPLPAGALVASFAL